MTENCMDSNVSHISKCPPNVQPPCLLPNNTKMFIIPPNLLKNICLGETIVEENMEQNKKRKSITKSTMKKESKNDKAENVNNSNLDITVQSPHTSKRGRKRIQHHDEEPSPENQTKGPKHISKKLRLGVKIDDSQQTLENFFSHNTKDTKKQGNKDIEEQSKNSIKLDTNNITNGSNRTNQDNDETATKCSSPSVKHKSTRKSNSSACRKSSQTSNLNTSIHTDVEQENNEVLSSRRSGRLQKQPYLQDHVTSNNLSSEAEATNDSLAPGTQDQNSERLCQRRPSRRMSKDNRSTISITPAKQNDHCQQDHALQKDLGNSKDVNNDESTKVEESTEVFNEMNSVIMNESVDAEKNNEKELSNSTNLNCSTEINERNGSPEKKTPGRRGRRPKKTSEDQNISVLLSPTSPVTCSKCKEVLQKKYWSNHNLQKHNNMAWIEGEKPMDFENDIKLWRRILTAAHKKKKGQLMCEMCKTIKRSVNGFISHMQFCGKTEEERRNLMVQCPLCRAVMMPSSMEIHERTHRQIEKNKLRKETSPKPQEEVDRNRRKAAQQALTKISETASVLISDADKAAMKENKFSTSVQKTIMKLPKNKTKIPSIWKSLWKKEIKANGSSKCRHIGCTYSSNSFDELCNHCTVCCFRTEESCFCKICEFSTKSKEVLIKHIQEEHNTEEIIDRNSDFEGQSESSDDSKINIDNNKPRKVRTPKIRESTNEKTGEGVKPKFTNKLKFVENEQTQGAKYGQPYIPSVRWTMEFEQKHYQLSLFEEYSPNDFTLLRDAEAQKYLPELQKSMRSKTVKNIKAEEVNHQDVNWNTWTAFEGGFDGDVPTFFTGGPIWALAWLPIPAPMYSKKPDQFIALSTHPDMQIEYAVGKSYTGPNIIQIWNLGHLNNEVTTTKNAPTFSYGIAHNNGTIWCLEWCPSGCYQDPYLHNYHTDKQKHKRRMGLLAAACSDGCVHIYSLPFPEELKKLSSVKDGQRRIFETKPVLTLVVDTSLYDNNEQNWQCTKISWTREHGHNTIAAGYSNGYIALWDLTIKLPYLMEKRQATYFVNAFQHFFAHGNAVSMVAFVPYNGQRYLASGSIDKSYKFWDLENISSPQTVIKRGIITDGTWMINWPCAVISFDDAFTFQRSCSLVLPLREYAHKILSILSANCTSFSIAVSDYSNAIAHGTLSGDIVTIFPHRILYRSEKVSQRRRLSSFIKIVDLKETSSKKKDKKDKKQSKDYNYMPETYKDSKDRFGMIFCDKQNDNWSRLDRSTVPVDQLTSFPIEQYPFTSANKISWNSNCWSYLWLISGYHNGMVRLLSFKPVPMISELMSSIPWHAERMLKKRKPL